MNSFPVQKQPHRDTAAFPLHVLSLALASLTSSGSDLRDASVVFSKNCSTILTPVDVCFSILHGFGGGGSDISLIGHNDEERGQWAPCLRSYCVHFTGFTEDVQVLAVILPHWCF